MDALDAYAERNIPEILLALVFLFVTGTVVYGVTDSIILANLIFIGGLAALYMAFG